MKSQSSLLFARKSSRCLVLGFGVYCTSGIAGWLPALSPDVLDTIRDAAMQRVHSSAAPQQRSLAGAQNAHPLGVQVLFVEAKEQKKKSASSALQAEVFLFDYQRVQASVELVDAASGELISAKMLNSDQLPLNAVEANYAIQLLHGSADFYDRLGFEYQQQFDQALVDEKSIDMKVSVWVPDARVYKDTPCLNSRCALVSVFTNQHYNFSIEPIVDLVTGDVYLDLMQ